jgi:hypothetical protein
MMAICESPGVKELKRERKEEEEVKSAAAATLLTSPLICFLFFRRRQRFHFATTERRRRHYRNVLSPKAAEASGLPPLGKTLLKRLNFIFGNL